MKNGWQTVLAAMSHCENHMNIAKNLTIDSVLIVAGNWIATQEGQILNLVKLKR